MTLHQGIKIAVPKITDSNLKCFKLYLRLGFYIKICIQKFYSY